MARQRLAGLRDAEIHRLIGGDPSLDFANTVNGHDRERPHEYLKDFRDVALWGHHAGLLSHAETRAVLRRATANAAVARMAYRRTLQIREVIFRVFRSVSEGRLPSAADLRALNSAWHKAQEHTEVVMGPHGVAVHWDEQASLSRVAEAASLAAVNLLTSARVERVRACAGDRCDWLFVDNSRNHLRRWCSMDECGNHAKMRRRHDRLAAVSSKRRQASRSTMPQARPR